MDALLVRRIVDKKEEFLRRHLVLSDSVIEKLGRNEVIGEYARKQLEADKGHTTRQLNLLLTALKVRGVQPFQRFLGVLRDTFHGWIADDIIGSTIEFTNGNGSITSVAVADILKRSYQENQQQRPYLPAPVLANRYVGLDVPFVFYKPAYSPEERQTRHKRENRRRKWRTGSAEFSGDSDKFNPYEVLSPIARAPENIRFLQTMFDKERHTTQKSIAVLRKEEDTIKSLLQQNLNEQKQVLHRQEALSEIRDRFRQINSKARILYRPNIDTERTKSRLRHLQRMDWLGDE